jgi:hypothetical protein
MSNQQSLNQFFTGKILQVPKYQRSYAWEKENITELYEDIQEALDTNSSHYIGTIVLARTENKNKYYIVDGQQRLTSIVMFINALVDRLDDKADKDYYRRLYIRSKDSFKLTPLERDIAFFNNMLTGTLSIEPHSKSQRYMLDAYNEICNIIDAFIDAPLDFLKSIEELYALEFIEDRESDAIRIFQTVNDRGKELSRMDKMKSLLFYFSNKYLDEKLDNKINDCFGEIFEVYDDIKIIGEEQRINIISSNLFNEDDLLRHHHVCFSEENYDPTAQQVMDAVKIALVNHRKNNDFGGLASYIDNYLDSLVGYVQSFKKVIERSMTDAQYYKLFSILGLSAVYYPIVTQLERRNLLSELLPSKTITVLDMIELIDVRVFKVRDYQGKKHIAAFAYQLNNNTDMSIKDIETHLLWFNSFEISNERFKDSLSSYDYFKQTGLLRHMFIDYCERIISKSYDIQQLKKIMDRDPTIEHILSQTPTFRPRSYGFKNNEDFEGYKNLIGNLTILEKRINSSIKNSGLMDKAKGYGKSQFKMTKQLATSLSKSKTFKKEDLVARIKVLVDDLSQRWWA